MRGPQERLFGCADGAVMTLVMGGAPMLFQTDQGVSYAPTDCKRKTTAAITIRFQVGLHFACRAHQTISHPLAMSVSHVQVESIARVREVRRAQRAHLTCTRTQAAAARIAWLGLIFQREALPQQSLACCALPTSTRRVPERTALRALRGPKVMTACLLIGQ